MFGLFWFLSSCLLFALGSVQNGAEIESLATSITNPTGTINSENYPNGYNSEAAQSWRLRVTGANFYTLNFLDMDLDTGGCYDYIVVYDDSDYTAPGKTYCNKPDSPVVINSDRITISFLTGSSWSAGERGSGFKISYTINNLDTATTLPVTTTTMATTTTPVDTTQDTSATTSVPPTETEAPETDPTTTTTTPQTPPQTTTDGSGNFPPGSQDDSRCGIPVVEPQITGFDYKGQGNSVSGSSSSSRVVNGENVVPHSWPWQVSLQGSYGSAYCGGTLVRDQWVVTAAHCAALIFIGTYGSDQVALGMHDKRVQESSRQLIDIVEVRVHPQYDNPDRSHDVALVKMKTPAILNDHVSLACEAHEGWVFPAGMQCVVTGWGVTAEGGNVGTSVLQQAPIPLLSDQDCFDLYQQANLDTTEDMQCAGGQEKGACNGDSGGPLHCFVNGRWYHMGIVSFGEANCDTEIASVFARVAELREFIDSVIA